MTLTEFLRARIAEDEADAMTGWRWMSLPAGEYERLQARILAECEAKRRIVDLHKAWPVLVETPPVFESTTGDLSHATFSMSKQIMWATEQEYRERFGAEPPTAPMLAALAAAYADHADYDETWRP